MKVALKVNQLFSLQVTIFLLNSSFVGCHNIFFMCTNINGLPTICLIRVVNETPSNLTRMNKEFFCCRKNHFLESK